MDGPHRSSRREFLQGKSAGHALGDLAQQGLALPGAYDAPQADSSYLLHIGRQAMACQFQVYLNAGQYANETEAALAALDALEPLEEMLSYFRPTSQLSRVNLRAAYEAVEVEPPLFELFELALRLHADTGGAFDMTAAPLWEVWGFARRQGAMPSGEQIADALQCVGSHLVQLDRQQRTIRFAKPGVRLNLGSIGKGYAVDCCGAALLAAGVEHFLVHGGGSSLVARGDRGAAQRTEEPPASGDETVAAADARAGSTSAPASGTTAGWDVGLPHPLRPERRLGEFRVRDRAMGTSGSQAQSFWHQGRRYGHILDPRTGRPAQNAFSVSVLAPCGALADALSTAFYVMRPEEVLEYCKQHPEIGVALSCPARRAGGLELKTANLTPNDLILGEPTPD